MRTEPALACTAEDGVDIVGDAGVGYESESEAMEAMYDELAVN